jgi:WD40 repeat protein
MASLSSFLQSTAFPVEWLDSTHFLTAIGCNLAIGTLSDPDRFEFLEGHSTLITAFALDPSRRICVSGQAQKESHTESGVPVIAWDLQTKRQLLVLRGHKASIRKIAISEDARIVAVCDDVGKKLWIWDLREQDLACFLDIPEPVTSLVFGGSSKDTWYLHVTVNILVLQFTIRFDDRTFEFKTEKKQYQSPSTGYKRERTHNAGAYVFPYYFVGTNAGDLGVYNAASLTIRAHLPVDRFPVTFICTTDDPSTLLVAGRGLSIVGGTDKEWEVKKTSEPESPIVWISVLGKKALLRMADTAIVLVDLPSLSRRTISRGTIFQPSRIAATNEAVAVALGENGLTILAISGGRLSHASYDQKIHASAIAVTPAGTFVVGCVEGALLSVDASGAKLWVTQNVHRGKITAICATAEFIATGGQDGLIRVITHKSRSIVNELLVHQGKVEQIIPAVGFPQRVHSVSADRTLTTTDIATGKRICQQLTAARMAFTSIAQFTDGETEILVSLGDGSIRGCDWLPRESCLDRRSRKDCRLTQSLSAQTRGYSSVEERVNSSRLEISIPESGNSVESRIPRRSGR